MKAVWIFVSYVLLVALLSESEAAPRRAKDRRNPTIDDEPQEEHEDDHERKRRAVRESRGPTLNDNDQEEPSESEEHERKRRAAEHDDIKKWLEDPQRSDDRKRRKKGKKKGPKSPK